MGQGRRRVAALSVLLATGIASAQTAPAPVIPSLDLRGFAPPTDPNGSLYLEPTTTPGSGEWNVGAFGSYALRPVGLDGSDGDRLAHPVAHQVSVDYIAALGIGRRLAFGVVVPTIPYQAGDEVERLLPGSGPLPRSAFGDVAFGAKATLLPPDQLGGLGLAAVGRVTAPTGNPGSYASEGSATGELRLLGELELLAIAFRATAGAKVRGTERRLVDDGTDDFAFGHLLPWGAGITLRPQALGIDPNGRWRWTAEARGAVALTPRLGSAPQSPALLGLSGRYAVGGVSVLAGVELPLNAAVGVPVVRPVIGIGWAPRFKDTDDDGIPDEDDLCPELPEDLDGFQDDDGCPEEGEASRLPAWRRPDAEAPPGGPP